MVEAAQPPKTGEIAVKRHGFGENHSKITPRMAQNGPVSQSVIRLKMNFVTNLKSENSRPVARMLKAVVHVRAGTPI